MAISLARHPFRKAPRGPVICAVMDGIGIGSGDEGDAVFHAYTPTLAWLRTLPSFAALKAHGTFVGMPSDADMGNSEVGHNVLGSGRVVDQGAKLVSQAIETGEMWRGECWRELVANVMRNEQPLHFLGLLSDGNVHSHISHLLAMLARAASEGVKKLRVHILLDGRDVPARSALQYVERLEALLSSLRAQGCDAKIASGGGRMLITMDRYEADWSMVARGWQTHVLAQGNRFVSAHEAICAFYQTSEQNDQWIHPFVIADASGPVGPIENGSSVVLFNFRGDRAMEIARAFTEETFNRFNRESFPHIKFAGMTQYDGDLHIPPRFLVGPPRIDHPIGELLSSQGVRQLAIAETQKFGHVTYFWNGNRSGKFSEELETYVEIPSDSGDFATRPWMKAAEVTDALIQNLRHRHYDFVRLNYANGDMVGHTGNFQATRLAVEVVDLCLARLVQLTKELHGVLLVTSDHGNADTMLERSPNGELRQRTSHNTNPVLFAIFDPREPQQGPTLHAADPQMPAQLAQVTATCMELLGFSAPHFMMPSLLSSSS